MDAVIEPDLMIGEGCGLPIEVAPANSVDYSARRHPGTAISQNVAFQHPVDVNFTVVSEAVRALALDNGLAPRGHVDATADRSSHLQRGVFWDIDAAQYRAEHEEMVLDRDMGIDRFARTDGLHNRNDDVAWLEEDAIWLVGSVGVH